MVEVISRPNAGDQGEPHHLQDRKNTATSEISKIYFPSYIVDHIHRIFYL